MSDLTDDPTFLASVYLDDEATRDERALVETSPETLGEVERLGRVRTVLAATVEPVSLAEREGHLAAALDVWERMSIGDGTGEVTPAGGVDAAAAAALTTARSSSSGRRGRGSKRSGWASSPWLLGAAAALVVVAGVGAVLRGGVGSGNDDASPLATEPNAALEAQSAEATDRAPADQGADAPTADPAADEQPASTESSSEADLSAQATGAGTGDPGSEAPLVRLESTDDLAAFAAAASGAEGESTDSFENGSCEDRLSIDLIVDVAFFEDTPVTVGIDLPESIAVAYTTDDCTVVAQTPLAK
jgi:hypothetical protein